MLSRRLVLITLAFSLLATGAVSAAEPLKILFVDTGNTGRSLMSEVLARTLASRGNLPMAFISRGLDVDPFDERPEGNAQSLMTQRGIDVGEHRARSLAANDVDHADLILTMTVAHAGKLVADYPDAKAKTFSLALYAVGSDEPIPDAWGRPMDAYRSVLAQLDRLLPLALAKAAKTPPPAPK